MSASTTGAWSPCLKPGACPCPERCHWHQRAAETAAKLATADPFDIARAIARYAETIPLESCSQ
jgi:hypothetical protein